MGALSEVLAAKLGRDTRAEDNPLNSVIGTSVLQILRNNPDRLGFSVVNLSANTVFIGPFPDVSSTKGFFLAANGGSISLSPETDFSVIAYEWSAIADAVSSQIFVQEEIAEKT